MTTATLSAVTTASGTVVMVVLALVLVGRELRRQAGHRPGSGSARVAAAMTILLGADVVLRFVSLAHGH